MLEDIQVLLGGRVAEALVLEDISTGASNDIERATETARKMVTKYGMSEKLGPIVFGASDNNEVFLGRDFGHTRNYSEEVAAEIDKEINRIITNGYVETEKKLTEHMDKLHAVAQYLFLTKSWTASSSRPLWKAASRWIPRPSPLFPSHRSQVAGCLPKRRWRIRQPNWITKKTDGFRAVRFARNKKDSRCIL